jgi:organic hydroperoxide reductase OsmC/OhrA
VEKIYTYHARAQFHHHDRSFVELEHGAPRILHFSAPPEFGGEAGTWTPEHFLLASVASCFVETFKGVARASRLEFQGIEVAVEGMIEKQGGSLRFTRITIRPALILYHQADQSLAERLLARAEQVCLVARSLSSSIVLESKVLVEEPVAAGPEPVH